MPLPPDQIVIFSKALVRIVLIVVSRPAVKRDILNLSKDIGPRTLHQVFSSVYLQSSMFRARGSC